MPFIERFNLDGRTALVSGASRGIGEHIACALAEQGAHVIVASRRQESCEAVAEKICKAGFDAEPRACHAGNSDQIDALFAYIRTRFGRLDIVINCAATNPQFGPLEETEVPAFNKTVEVNLLGPLLISAQALPLMREQKRGSIVNVSSVNGLVPGYYQSVYSATKAALINLTQSLALENGAWNIRANALLPGLTDTRFIGALKQDQARLDAAVKNWPLGRMAQADELACAALFMASDASSYMTGQTIVLDGGMALRGL